MALAGAQPEREAAVRTRVGERDAVGDREEAGRRRRRRHPGGDRKLPQRPVSTQHEQAQRRQIDVDPDPRPA